MKRTLVKQRLVNRTLINSGLLLLFVLPLVLVGSAAAVVCLPILTLPPSSAMWIPTAFSHRTTLQNFRTRQSCSDQPEPGHGVTAARDFILAQYESIPGCKSGWTRLFTPAARRRLPST